MEFRRGDCIIFSRFPSRTLDSEGKLPWPNMHLHFLQGLAVFCGVLVIKYWENKWLKYFTQTSSKCADFSLLSNSGGMFIPVSNLTPSILVVFIPLHTAGKLPSTDAQVIQHFLLLELMAKSRERCVSPRYLTGSQPPWPPNWQSTNTSQLYLLHSQR